MRGVLCSFLITAALALPAFADEPPATIAVTGQGTVDTQPDLATVILGVTTEERTAQAALGANSARMAEVLEGLTRAGIEARDIQSTGLSLSPRYDYRNDGGAPKLTGYIAVNSVTVRVRALDNLGAVLDGVVSDGANTLNGLYFGLQDHGAVLDEARRLAVVDGRHRAELYAQAAGVELGDILSISEPGGIVRPGPVFAAEAASLRAADVPVAAGELTIASSVTMVFEIESH